MSVKASQWSGPLKSDSSSFSENMKLDKNDEKDLRGEESWSGGGRSVHLISIKSNKPKWDHFILNPSAQNLEYGN